MGVGVFSLTEAALSEMRFLCSKFHYIRVQQGGGGVRGQLALWYWDTKAWSV